MLIKSLISLGSLLSLSVMLTGTANAQGMADQYRQEQGDAELQPEGCLIANADFADSNESLKSNDPFYYDFYCIDYARKLIHRQIHYNPLSEEPCNKPGGHKCSTPLKWTKPFGKIINRGLTGDEWYLVQYEVKDNNLVRYVCFSRTTTHCTGSVTRHEFAERIRRR